MELVDAISATRFDVGCSSGLLGSIAALRHRERARFVRVLVGDPELFRIDDWSRWLVDAPRPRQYWNIPCGRPSMRFGFEAASFVLPEVELAQHALRVPPSTPESIPDVRLHQPVPPSVKAGAKLERKLGIYPMIEPPPIIPREVRSKSRK